MRRLWYICALAIGGLVIEASVSSGLPLMAQNWRDLSPRQRYDALQNYRQHERLPQQEQDEIEERYERWRKMPPDERDRIRQNFERFQNLPPSEQERFERKFEKWKRGGSPHR